MTFSILARNPKTGEIGGAAATGNLCVGGWVLRGDIKKGVTASQGFYPSTLSVSYTHLTLPTILLV